MSVLKINSSNFEEVKKSGAKVLLDFYADWCGPCRMVAPAVEEIAEERADVIVGKINVDDSAELAGDFKVFSIPTLVVLENGNEVARAVGARSKAQILSLINGNNA